MTKSICVWYWIIALPYVWPFLKNSCWKIYIVDFVNKTSHDKPHRAQTKSRTSAIGYRQILP